MKPSPLELGFSALAAGAYGLINPTPVGVATAVGAGLLLLGTMLATRAASRIPLLAKGGGLVPLLLIPAIAVAAIIGLLVLLTLSARPAEAAINDRALIEQNATAPAQAPATEQLVTEVLGLLKKELASREPMTQAQRLDWMKAMSQCLSESTISAVTETSIQALGTCADARVTRDDEAAGTTPESKAVIAETDAPSANAKPADENSRKREDDAKATSPANNKAKDTKEQ